MKQTERFLIARREFIASASFLALGGGLLGISALPSYPSRSIQELREELTPEELKFVEASKWAKDLENYFGKGYSCAESLFAVSLKFLRRSRKLIWIASGFGGGMYHRDLCGFLTSGCMAIGFSASKLRMERKEAKEICSSKIKDYWKWWTSMAPLHCSEIRKEGTSSKVCIRLGRLASAKVEELVMEIGSFS